jgi:hypothetical protein
LFAVNKHLGTYSGYGNLLSFQFVQVWDYWCSLDYSVALWGDSSKCRGFKTVRVVFSIYHTDKLVVGNKHLVSYSGQGILFPSHSYLNISEFCHGALQNELIHTGTGVYVFRAPVCTRPLFYRNSALRCVPFYHPYVILVFVS